MINNIQNIIAKVAAVVARRATLSNLIGDRQHARAQIEGAIASASGSLDAAHAVLAVSLTLEAVGEGEPGEVAVARAAVLAAEKALGAARKHEGEARELAAAESGLAARAAPLEAEIAELRRQEADARFAVMVAELHRRIDAYTATAATLMQQLAAALALDTHLNGIGKPQEVGSGYPRQTEVGMFGGRTLPNIGDLMSDARLRVFAEFNSPLL